MQSGQIPFDASHPSPPWAMASAPTSSSSSSSWSSGVGNAVNPPAAAASSGVEDDEAFFASLGVGPQTQPPVLHSQSHHAPTNPHGIMHTSSPSRSSVSQLRSSVASAASISSSVTAGPSQAQLRSSVASIASVSSSVTAASPPSSVGGRRVTTTPNPFTAARAARASRSRDSTVDAAAQLFTVPTPSMNRLSSAASTSSDNFFDSFGLSDSSKSNSGTANGNHQQHATSPQRPSRVLDVLGITGRPSVDGVPPPQPTSHSRLPPTKPEPPAHPPPSTSAPVRPQTAKAAAANAFSPPNGLPPRSIPSRLGTSADVNSGKPPLAPPQRVFSEAPQKREQQQQDQQSMIQASEKPPAAAAIVPFVTESTDSKIGYSSSNSLSLASPPVDSSNGINQSAASSIISSINPFTLSSDEHSEIQEHVSFASNFELSAAMTPSQIPQSFNVLNSSPSTVNAEAPKVGQPSDSLEGFVDIDTKPANSISTVLGFFSSRAPQQEKYQYDHHVQPASLQRQADPSIVADDLDDLILGNGSDSGKAFGGRSFVQTHFVEQREPQIQNHHQNLPFAPNDSSAEDFEGWETGPNFSSIATTNNTDASELILHPSHRQGEPWTVVPTVSSVSAVSSTTTSQSENIDIIQKNRPPTEATDCGDKKHSSDVLGRGRAFGSDPSASSNFGFDGQVNSQGDSHFSAVSDSHGNYGGNDHIATITHQAPVHEYSSSAPAGSTEGKMTSVHDETLDWSGHEGDWDIGLSAGNDGQQIIPSDSANLYQAPIPTVTNAVAQNLPFSDVQWSDEAGITFESSGDDTAASFFNGHTTGVQSFDTGMPSVSHALPTALSHEHHENVHMGTTSAAAVEQQLSNTTGFQPSVYNEHSGPQAMPTPLSVAEQQWPVQGDLAFESAEDAESFFNQHSAGGAHATSASSVQYKENESFAIGPNESAFGEPVGTVDFYNQNASQQQQFEWELGKVPVHYNAEQNGATHQSAEHQGLGASQYQRAQQWDPSTVSHESQQWDQNTISQEPVQHLAQNGVSQQSNQQWDERAVSASQEHGQYWEQSNAPAEYQQVQYWEQNAAPQQSIQQWEQSDGSQQAQYWDQSGGQAQQQQQSQQWEQIEASIQTQGHHNWNGSQQPPPQQMDQSSVASIQTQGLHDWTGSQQPPPQQMDQSQGWQHSSAEQAQEQWDGTHVTNEQTQHLVLGLHSADQVQGDFVHGSQQPPPQQIDQSQGWQHSSVEQAQEQWDGTLVTNKETQHLVQGLHSSDQGHGYFVHPGGDQHAVQSVQQWNQYDYTSQQPNSYASGYAESFPAVHPHKRKWEESFTPASGNAVEQVALDATSAPLQSAMSTTIEESQSHNPLNNFNGSSSLHTDAIVPPLSSSVVYKPDGGFSEHYAGSGSLPVPPELARSYNVPLQSDATGFENSNIATPPPPPPTTSSQMQSHGPPPPPSSGGYNHVRKPAPRTSSAASFRIPPAPMPLVHDTDIQAQAPPQQNFNFGTNVQKFENPANESHAAYGANAYNQPDSNAVKPSVTVDLQQQYHHYNLPLDNTDTAGTVESTGVNLAYSQYGHYNSGVSQATENNARQYPSVVQEQHNQMQSHESRRSYSEDQRSVLSGGMSVELNYIICQSCSKQIEAESAFCRHCGTRVSVVRSPAPPTQDPAVPPKPPQVAPTSSADAPPPAAGGYWDTRKSQTHAPLNMVDSPANYNARNMVGGPPGIERVQSGGGIRIPNALPEAAPSFVDPLGRHQGHSVAVFGFGGKLVVTGTIKQQRLMTGANGSSAMVQKTCPGRLTIISVQSAMVGGSDAELPKFPGPLVGPKSKLKKKDIIKLAEDGMKLAEGKVSDALAAIESERRSGGPVSDNAMATWLFTEDTACLWKLLKLMVENDGALMNPNNSKGDAALKAFREVLLAARVPRQDSHILDEIQSALLRGDKIEACNIAINRGLWSHAQVLSSQIDKEVYRDVVLKFAREDLSGDPKPPREPLTSLDRPALRVLYSLFCGRGQQAVLEFLPSEEEVEKRGISYPQFDCISNWKEVLLIILANRTPGDLAVISALGDQLKSYGLNISAQICYALSASPGTVSGLDANGTRVVLFGSDHTTMPSSFARDFQALHMTEIYEFAQMLSAPGAGGGLPHLQAYKLFYAMWLADMGFLELSSRYCESVEHQVKLYTKGSPYFHSLFIRTLRDLFERLSTVQAKGSGDSKEGTSWFSKVAKFESLASTFGHLMNTAIGEAPPSSTPPMSSMSRTVSTDAGQTLLSEAIPSEAPVMTRPNSTPALIFSNTGSAALSKHQSAYGNGYTAETAFNAYSEHGQGGYYGQQDTQLQNQQWSHQEQYQGPQYTFQSQGELLQPLSQPEAQHQNQQEWSQEQYQPQAQEQYQPQAQEQYQPQEQEQYQPQAQEQYQPQAQELYQPQAQEQYQPQELFQTQGYHQSQQYYQSQEDYQSQGQYQAQELYQHISESQQEPIEPTLNHQVPQSTQWEGFGNQAYGESSGSVVSTGSNTQSTKQNLDVSGFSVEEDLGFGNPKPRRNSEDLGFGTKKTDKLNDDTRSLRDVPRDSTASSSSSTSAPVAPPKASGWGIFSFFGGKKNDDKGSGSKTLKADLGQSLNITYDKERKIWVDRDGNPIGGAAKAPPPPPMTSSWSAPATRNSTPNASDVQSGAAINGPPMRPSSTLPPADRSSSVPGVPVPNSGPVGFGSGLGTGRSSVGPASRRGARNRYVDVMNPDAKPVSTQAVKSFLPTASTQFVDASTLPAPPPPMPPSENDSVEGRFSEQSVQGIHRTPVVGLIGGQQFTEQPIQGVHTAMGVPSGGVPGQQLGQQRFIGGPGANGPTGQPIQGVHRTATGVPGGGVPGQQLGQQRFIGGPGANGPTGQQAQRPGSGGVGGGVVGLQGLQRPGSGTGGRGQAPPPDL